MITRPEQRRIAMLRKRMKAGDIKALLVSRREDVRYLTGFTGSAGSVIVTGGRPCLVTDFRYKTQARKETDSVSLRIQKKDHFSAVRETAGHLGADELWFDEASLTVDAFKKLKRLGLKLTGCSDLVGELRQHKDGYELANIRRAIRRAEESFLELRKYLRPGITERELGFKLECLMKGKGARRPAFDTIVASGKNGSMPHATLTGKRIKRGDLVTIDFGAESEGYFSDITRTVCVGKPSPRQREIHDLVLRAQAEAIKSVRPGVSCKAVDDAARDVIKKAGHGKHFGHATGHGIGLMVHEGPSISSLSKAMVESGMVFTVEPGVYVPEWGGVRIEDMVMVTENGVHVLTTLPRTIDFKS